MTMNRRGACLLTVIFILMASAPAFAETGSLDPGKWAPRNYQIMSKFTAENGKRNPKYDPSKKPYTVFDWDNTAISGDCEDALMYYMINNLKFPSAGFLNTLEKGLPEGRSNLKNAEDKEVDYMDIFDDIKNDYGFISKNYKGYGGPMSLDKMQETEQFRDFHAKMIALMDSLYGKLEYPAYLSLQARMFAGLSVDEIEALSYEADIYAMGAETKKVELVSPEVPAWKSGGHNHTLFGCNKIDSRDVQPHACPSG